MSPQSVPEPGILVIAHRGDSHRAPENTLAAFRAALDAGADYVELDARPSADATFYCLHDPTLDRTTDVRQILGGSRIAITGVRDADLNRLDAGSWFHPRFAGEPLPTLAAALEAIQPRACTLLEVKDGSPEACARLIHEKGLEDRLILQSFNWQFLREFHRLLPAVRLAALGQRGCTRRHMQEIAASGADIVAWHFRDLDRPMIDRLHAAGCRVFAWTADEPRQWQKLVSEGIDGIISNRPGELRAFLEGCRLR